MPLKDEEARRKYGREYQANYRKLFPGKVRDSQRQWWITKMRGDGNRKRQLRCRYGITVEEYNKILEQQGGKCAICQKATRAYISGNGTRHLHVDHNHRTGRVRGLLCNRCNMVLGFLNDGNEEVIGRIVSYLKKTREDLNDLPSYIKQTP